MDVVDGVDEGVVVAVKVVAGCLVGRYVLIGTFVDWGVAVGTVDPCISPMILA
ncbi:MAG: hypothetical protein AAB784_02835 [Patescibacteria group bacterium]